MRHNVRGPLRVLVRKVHHSLQAGGQIASVGESHGVLRVLGAVQHDLYRASLLIDSDVVVPEQPDVAVSELVGDPGHRFPYLFDGWLPPSSAEPIEQHGNRCKENDSGIINHRRLC